MDGRFNTIAGWVLGAGIVFLGANLLAGEIFKGGHSDKMGFPVNGAEEAAGGGASEQPIAFYLQTADAARGERAFAKCAGCHTINQGGANGTGPNLWGTMGEAVATGHGGFAFSDALRSKGGTWDWNTMSEWLSNPKKFAPGTKMTFAGLGNPEDRANVIAFLNAHSDAPRPLPAAPPETAAAEADDAGAQKAENEPVLNEQQAVAGGQKNVGGEGAPKVSGTDPAKD